MTLKRIILIIFIAVIGIGMIVDSNRQLTDEIYSDIVKDILPPNLAVQGGFKYMGGDTFLSPSGIPRYSDDCIGCAPSGDIFIYHNTERNPANTRYTLDANCGENGNGRVVERGLKFNDQGQAIGERCITIVGREARIFWTDGDEYWIIGAPTVPIVIEFEQSNAFKTWLYSQT